MCRGRLHVVVLSRLLRGTEQYVTSLKFLFLVRQIALPSAMERLRDTPSPVLSCSGSSPCSVELHNVREMHR